MRYFDTGWRVEVVGWALRYRDRIVSVGTGNTTTDGRDIVQSVNAASSTLHGLEAGLVTDLSARVQIEARLSYTRGTQRVAGAEEPGDRIPPLHGRVIVRFEPLQTWQFESWLAAATGQDPLAPLRC